MQRRASALMEDFGRLAGRLGLVEVELCVGDEPEDGVEVEAVGVNARQIELVGREDFARAWQ